MKIDLVLDACPLPPGAGANSRYPALERCVTRGDPIAFDVVHLESTLRALFDLPRTHELPAAPLSLLGDGIEPGNDQWLRLDPVHLRADRSRLVLVPLPRNDLTPEEIASVQAMLEAHLTCSGFELVSTPTGRWYLHTTRRLALRTRAPQACAGALDEQHLPAGDDGAELRRLVTEAQMLLHETAFNAAREASGKLAVTGVWPWGNGAMPAIGRSRYTHACSDDPIVRGIARASGAECAPMPPDAASLTPLPPDASLLVVGSGTDISLADFERNWIDPLTKQIEGGAIVELRLLLLTADRCIARRITRRHLHRWWRRAKPLLGRA